MILVIVSAVLTCELLRIIPIVGNARLIAARAKKAGQVVSSKSISDHWKEKALPAYAKRIGFSSVTLFVQMLMAFSPFLIFGLFHAGGLPGLSATLIEPAYILGLTVFSIAYLWLRAKISRPSDKSSDYSAGDRLLHRLALGVPILPEVIHDVEKATYLKKAPEAREGQHVFICGLARAGTTALLRELHATGEFGSLAYRDMPFVLAPNLWSKLSGQRSLAARERAHGDGIIVDLESPEALDEVYWRLFCGDDYITDTALRPHQPDRDDLAGFEDLVRLVLLRNKRVRYLSKNNNSILRIPALAKHFPNARFLVPVRDPVYHAASLMNQHVHFGSPDTFTINYMRWLGHHEFGADHRPFDFGGPVSGDPDTPDYWLHRWIAAYEHLIAVRDQTGAQVIAVDMEGLSAHPGKWQTLAQQVGIECPHPQTLRTPNKTKPPVFSQDLVEKSKNIHAQILATPPDRLEH